MTQEGTNRDGSEAGKADEAQSDSPLYEELVRLRIVGLAPDVTERLQLPEMLKIADASSPDTGDEIDRLKAAMKLATRRLGGGDYSLALEDLWGVSDKMYGKSLPTRRKKALELLDVASVVAYERSLRKRMAEDFERALLSLYAEKAADPETTAAETNGREQFEDIAPERDAESGSKDSARRPRRQRAFIGSLAIGIGLLAVAAGVYAIAHSSSGNNQATMLPPPGTAINARTGQIEDHPRIRPPKSVNLIGGGPIFRACDASDEPTCEFRDAPLNAQLGDTLKFLIILDNEAPVPLPFAKISADDLRPLEAKQSQVVVSSQIVWPTASGSHSPKPAELHPLTIDLPVSAGPGEVTYIPGSTVLLNPKLRVVAQLPDGILESRGVALTNIGRPLSCFFNCRVAYIRYLEFEAKVMPEVSPFQ